MKSSLHDRRIFVIGLVVFIMGSILYAIDFSFIVKAKESIYQDFVYQEEKKQIIILEYRGTDKEVIIPEGLDTLYHAFSNCTNLKVQIPRSVVNLPSEEHTSDFPLFTNCKNCTALVYKNSKMQKYCKENNIPYQIIKE